VGCTIGSRERWKAGCITFDHRSRVGAAADARGIRAELIFSALATASYHRRVAARDDLLAKADALDDEALGASGAKQDELRKQAAALRVEALAAKPYPVLVCASCYSLTGWLDDDGICAEDAMRKQQEGTGGFVDIRDDRPRYEDAPAPVGRRVARALGLGRRRDRAREWLMWIEPGATGPVDPEEGWEIEAPISFEQPAPSGPHLLVHFDTQSLRFEDGAWRPADTTRGGKVRRLVPREFPASLAMDALAEAWSDFKEEVAEHNRAVWAPEAERRAAAAAAAEERRLAGKTETGTSELLR
jgi:hypothetical protein